MNVVHIGLPKTATTTLQRYVFPELQQMGLVAKLNPPDVVSRLKNMTRGYKPSRELEELRQKIAEEENMLISVEGLVGADPASWRDDCKRNAKLFGRNTTILITLREPRSYLRSLYQQTIHQGNVIEPELFFLTDEEHRSMGFLPANGNYCAINTDAMNYLDLVQAYSENFKKVVVVAFDSLQDMAFADALFGTSKSQRDNLARRFAEAPRRNVAYSDIAMRLTFRRERLLKLLGLKSRGSEDVRLQKYLDMARGNPETDKPGYLKRRFRNILVWRKFMQKIIGKVLPYRKWELLDNVHLGVHFSQNRDFYYELVDAGGYMTFNGGKMATTGTNG